MINMVEEFQKDKSDAMKDFSKSGFVKTRSPTVEYAFVHNNLSSFSVLYNYTVSNYSMLLTSFFWLSSNSY